MKQTIHSTHKNNSQSKKLVDNSNNAASAVGDNNGLFSIDVAVSDVAPSEYPLSGWDDRPPMFSRWAKSSSPAAALVSSVKSLTRMRVVSCAEFANVTKSMVDVYYRYY